MNSLPRPLQNERLVEFLRALDDQHRVMGERNEGKGSWKLSVHYPPDGTPAFARVETTIELSLTTD
jgi:hypothetical protein